MEYSITQALYDWMHKRRIVSEIAAEMGLDSSTLAAKLRPKATQARLSADDLVPLCRAVREAGSNYGKELDGILHRFSREMFGAEPVKTDPVTMMSHVLALSKGMSALFDCADRISTMEDPAEIRRLRTLVSTTMLPVVLQMEDLLDQRLKKLEKSIHTAAEPQTTTEGTQGWL